MGAPLPLLWNPAFVEDEHFHDDSRKLHGLLQEFDRLVEKYPQEGYEAADLQADGASVVFIKDGAEFGQSLTLSTAAFPVEEFDVG